MGARLSFFQPARWMALVLGLVIAAAQAAPGQAAERDRIIAFLDVTGFDVALDSIANAAEDAPRMLGHEPSDFGHSWSALARDVFDTAKMRGMAIGMLEETLTDDVLGHAAAFYASPLGIRLVEEENAFHMVSHEAGVQAKAEALLADAEAQDMARVATLRRLGDAVGGEGLAVRAIQQMTTRFLMAASHAGVLGYRFDKRKLDALMDQREPELRRQVLQAGLANAAYTYRAFSNEELTAYAEALEHPKMKRMYELMNAIQFEIMANRFEVLARRMARLDPGEEL